MTFTMKQSIIVTLITVLILLVILMTGLIIIETRKKSTDDFENITPAWNERAKSIKAKMNVSADYCNDFYNYVCGSFVNSTTIPDDKKGINIFTTLNDKVMKQLNTIIDRPSKPEEPKVFKIAKHLYKICMDTEAIEEQGLQPFFNFLEQLGGGWPVLKKDNEWNETLFNWNGKSVEVFEKTRWSTNFFGFDLDTDIINNSRRVIILSDYYSSLPREDLLHGLDDESISNYFNYMVNMSVVLGAEQNHAKDELRKTLEFEITLMNLSGPSGDYENQSLNNKITLGNLEKKYPYFQWKKYLNHRLSPSNISVEDDEIIIVTNPDYFDQLGKLLDSTPKRIQANLVIWKEIQSSAKYLNEKIIKVYENYVKLTTGRIERPPRWIECTNTVSRIFPIAISALYVREYFQKDSKDNVEIMVKNIQNQFIKLINNTNWMDKETKLNAINKAEKIKRLVGYPDELFNNSKFDKYHEIYQDFEMTDDSFIAKIISLDDFNDRMKWSKLRQKNNPNEWIYFAAELSSVNAFYDSSANSIEITAAILQGEFFNNELPKYINYGAIGTTVGHEIMHAFDNRGKQYDANGNAVNWWSNSTNNEFKKKAQCIIDQYKNYTVQEINENVNGIKTQAENIADNGGIKAAYWAYVNWSNDNKNNSNNKFEKMLPGFNFTPRQMFWISYANTWCSKIRPETQKLILTYDNHSPSEFRVNGPLSNIEEFSTDFGCPKGSRMNPETKCTMW